MEKYTRWRDAGTGIAPLLPPVPPRDDPNKLLKALLLVPATVFGSVRTFSIVTSLALRSIFTIVFSFTIGLVSPSLAHSINSIITSIFLRIILYTVGFIWIDAQPVTIKRTAVNRNSVPQPTKGDLIVSNHSSWIDIIYIAFRYNPTFLFPVSDDDNTISGYVPVSSLWTALSTVGHTPASFPIGRSKVYPSVSDALLNTQGPLAFFPEATTSNNRGVLKPTNLNVFSNNINPKNKIKGKVFILSFKYDAPTLYLPTCVTPIPSNLTIVQSFFRIASSPLPYPLRSLKVRLLADRKESQGLSPLVADKQTEWTSQVLQIVAHLSHFKRTGISWKDKLDFLDYYNQRR